MGFLDIQTTATASAPITIWFDLASNLEASVHTDADYDLQLRLIAERIRGLAGTALQFALTRDNARAVALGRQPATRISSWHWQETLSIVFDWRTSIISPSEDVQALRNAWNHG
jgi:hypothetical protein